MGRIVNGALRSERAPVTTESTVSIPIWQWLLSLLFRLIARYWLELVYLWALVTVWSVVDDITPLLGPAAVAGLLGVIYAHEPSRRYFVKVLSQRRLRRRWDDAARHGGLATHNDHVPTPVRNGITQTPAGERLTVRIPSGSTADDLAGAGDAIATHLEAKEVRVTKHHSSARYAIVDIVRRDPLVGGESLTSPLMAACQFSMWDSVPLGIDEFGETVSVSFVEQNILKGGVPGAGKSVALSQIVAAAALDPHCRLTLLDGKQVEMAPWKNCAEYLTGPAVSEQMRYCVISNQKWRTVTSNFFATESGKFQWEMACRCM